MNVALKTAPTSAIVMYQVESSQIVKIGHCAASNTLAILFKSKTGDAGSLYHYDNVTESDYAGMIGAESIGSHFYKHIKPFAEKYPYRKVEHAPVSVASLTDLADAAEVDPLFPSDLELVTEIRKLCADMFGMSYGQTDVRMAHFNYQATLRVLSE